MQTNQSVNDLLNNFCDVIFSTAADEEFAIVHREIDQIPPLNCDDFMDVFLNTFHPSTSSDRETTSESSSAVLVTMDAVQKSIQAAGIMSSSAAVVSSSNQDVDMSQNEDSIGLQSDASSEDQVTVPAQRHYQELASQAANVLNSVDEYELMAVDPIISRRTLDHLVNTARGSLDDLLCFANSRIELEEKYLSVHKAFSIQRQGVRAYREMCFESDERIVQDYERYVQSYRHELESVGAESARKDIEIKKLKATISGLQAELAQKDLEIQSLKENPNPSISNPTPPKAVPFVRPTFTAPDAGFLNTPYANRFPSAI